jgi:hypothetical protein
MGKLACVLIFTIGALNCNSQYALVINNDAFVVIDGGVSATPVYLVIDESDGLGITTSGTGGNIISEGEFNKVQWNIGTNVDSYTIPFTSNNGTSDQKIPLSIETTGSAVGGNGRLRLSTWETADGNLSGTWPVDVTHLNTSATGLSNGLNVVDRFWIVDADNYTTKPSALLEFTYNDNNEIAGSNLINTGNESTLVGQSFDAATNTWRGNTSGTAVFYGAWTGARTVSGASVSDGDFFASWTLSLNSLLLPIELIDFNVECIDNHKVIKWSTKSEVNNDHFVIQMSHDGIEFENVAVVAGAGNSTMQNDYEYIHFAHFDNITYYRLVQIDFDGAETHSNMTAVDNCNGNLGSISVHATHGNQISISYDAQSASKYQVKVIDARGRLLVEPTELQTQKGRNQHSIALQNIDFGIYYVVIQNEIESSFKKIILHENH